MTSPLVLLLSGLILSSAGLEIQDNKDVGVKEHFQGREYVYDATPRNWTEAFQFCSGVNDSGYLAVIDSDAEKVVIRTMMAQNGATSIHLGFHDRHLEGEYYTLTDLPIQAHQWAVGSPKGGVAYNCGGFTAAGFTDTDCAEKQATICEYLKPEMNGYKLIPGHGYYKYNTTFTSWTDAWKTCHSEGAHLHIIDSLAEKEAVYDLFTYTSIYTGVHRVNANGNNEFHTVFGVPFEVTSFNYWYEPTEPFGSFSGFPYVYLRHLNQGLSTGSSTYFFRFICEIHLS